MVRQPPGLPDLFQRRCRCETQSICIALRRCDLRAGGVLQSAVSSDLIYTRALSRPNRGGWLGNLSRQRFFSYVHYIASQVTNETRVRLKHIAAQMRD